MKNIILAFAILSGFSAQAHEGCNGWGAYCSDFAGKGPQHQSVNLRMCQDGVLMVNAKEYFPISAGEAWSSKDGNTIASAHASGSIQYNFTGPDGNWTGTCAIQD